MNYTPLFQNLVDLEDLQIFIKPLHGHGDDPLRILCTFDACTNISIEKFGKPVVFLSEQTATNPLAALEVTKLEEKEGQVRLDFFHDMQAVGGHIIMQHNGADWMMKEYEVYET